MLSFIISNAVIVSQALTGMTPGTLESRVVPDYVNQTNAQSITVVSEAPQDARRDDITINEAPRTQSASLRPQTITQSLPASSSALVGSAFKYVGAAMDCTALVEYALRDLGYSVPDLAPTGFGSFGIVFNDPSQVQPGDIMMRGGHVAIYVGDGLAVQGGWGGLVVVASDLPSNYGSFVRLG